MNLIWLALVTGLTTGGISCLAVQGGLLASSLDSKNKLKGVLAFLVSKMTTYTLLGVALGAIGATLIVSPKILGWMQILAGLFMIATAARLLNVHPIFRHFVIEPPKFIFRILRKEANSQSLFAPAILGFMTILIPCGVTQAMMILAVSTGNALIGAGIMFAFTLGTSPIFLTIGVAAAEMLKRRWFSVVAALTILVLGIMSINSGQILRGSVHTLQNYWKAAFETKAGSNLAFPPLDEEGNQLVTIDVASGGYRSNFKKLKAGVPVKLTLKTNNTLGCSRSFVIPGYNINKILPQTGQEIVQFTPYRQGSLTYTCSMGMYTGQFVVE